MSLSGNFVRFSSFARLGPLSWPSGLQSSLRFSRRMSIETSGTSHSTSNGIPIGGLTVGPWDSNNRIRVIGAIAGVSGTIGILFDTFYRRATKQELNQAMEKLDAKIDGLTIALLQTNQHVDAKIDGLTNALLHTNQRDKIAAETENRELRREIERLKSLNSAKALKT